MSVNFNCTNSNCVVNKENAAVMLETVGVMCTVADMFTDTRINTNQRLIDLSNKLEAIAMYMLEEC